MFMVDMLECCERVKQYTAGMTLFEFQQNRLIYDATVRNLEILGEAARHIPPEIRTQLPEIKWNRITGMRNVLAHAYFGIDDVILWTIIKDNVPELAGELAKFLNQNS